MNTWFLWLRWSWRDLRRRWLQVLAIALIIALGTGIYSGLISTSAWRQESNDASYSLLKNYDLRLALTEGSFLTVDELRQAAAAIDHANWITAVEPRLILPTLVDASTADLTILIPGRIVGIDVAGGGPQVNAIHPTAGRALTAADNNRPVAVLEHKFANYYDLPSQGRLRLSGGNDLDYVGTGLSPEYFMIFTEEGGMMAEANFAVVFVPLSTAQTLSGRQGLANDLLLRLEDEADPTLVGQEISAAMEQRGGVGLTILEPANDPVYHMMYEDIDSDERFWRWMAYLFLAGAVFGAFNLAARLVEAQRREIGIQMALGVPPRRIAVRPLLVAGQIAILGVLLGLGAGLLIGRAFGDLLEAMIPLPIFVMPFQTDVFLQAAILGLVLPLLATLVPVIRALRVEPVEAIATGHLVAKGGGLAPLFAGRVRAGRVRTGRVMARMPLRNVLRAPRRALLTILGIAAAVSLLVLVMAMIDSFDATLEQAATELVQDEPQRMIVQLDFFYPVASPLVEAVTQAPEVQAAAPFLKLGGYLVNGETSIEVTVDLMDMAGSVWRPSINDGQYPAADSGLLISAKAARDLGVQLGDTILLRHPRRTGLLNYDWTETALKVSGYHRLPLRTQVYMSLEQAHLMRLDGLVNAIQIVPTASISQNQVKRALFSQAGVASIQPVTAVINIFDELIGEFVDIFLLIQLAAVALAALMAYNSASISLDERAREMATMFAFGVRVRAVLWVVVVETLITTMVGTILGCGLGLLLQWFMMRQVFSTVSPDIEVILTVNSSTLIAAAAVGVLVAALTPVLSIRKLTRMDIPAMLRVME